MGCPQVVHFQVPGDILGRSNFSRVIILGWKSSCHLGILRGYYGTLQFFSSCIRAVRATLPLCLSDIHGLIHCLRFNSFRNYRLNKKGGYNLSPPFGQLRSLLSVKNATTSTTAKYCPSNLSSLHSVLFTNIPRYRISLF